MVSYDSQVYYSKIDYQNKMNNTKELFIKGKYDGVSNEDFAKQVQGIWNNIDHKYMERTIQEQTLKVMNQDRVTMQEQQNLPNKYELNPTSTFSQLEQGYGEYITRVYENDNGHSTDYLTKRIKTFEKVERTIAYFRNGQIYSMHTPAEYLSMLYNVNLRMASWNQSIKDGQVLGIDLMVLESHPNACEICSSHMGKLYSISGKEYNIPNFGGSLDDAYADGVGHPNCKCNFTLYWNDDQLIQEPYADLYEPLQKARGLQRDIDRLITDYELYRYITNYGEADKTIEKIDKLQEQLDELLVLYDIKKFIQIIN